MSVGARRNPTFMKNTPRHGRSTYAIKNLDRNFLNQIPVCIELTCGTIGSTTTPFAPCSPNAFNCAWFSITFFFLLFVASRCWTTGVVLTNFIATILFIPTAISCSLYHGSLLLGQFNGIILHSPRPRASGGT